MIQLVEVVAAFCTHILNVPNHGIAIVGGKKLTHGVMIQDAVKHRVGILYFLEFLHGLADGSSFKRRNLNYQFVDPANMNKKQ